MSENNTMDNKYDALKEIDTQVSSLLKQKLSVLHNEVNKTQSIIENIDKKPIDYETKSKITKQLTISVLKQSFVKFCIPILASLLIVIGSLGMIDSNIGTHESNEHHKSKYVIENLRGDTIDTMKSWRLLEGETMNVNMINAHTLTYDQYVSAVDVIVSTESIEIDDFLLMKGPKDSTSVFFLGWEGAMQEAKKQNTQNVVPSNFNVFQSSSGEGDIIIDFETVRDADGYTGYTRSIVEDGEILKSYITVYDSDSLEPEDLANILRHEFGHALGLGHSTDPEDLMAPIITTEYPYISPCDVEAISVLYDGQEHSVAVCEK